MKLFGLNFVSVLLLLALISRGESSSAATMEKLPADSAGTINPATGQIAFIRGGDVWVMDAKGTEQKPVCRVGNAEGRLSWSPDNKRIVFTRSGFVDLKGPDMTGERHKVYDLFVCYLDSAAAGNAKYWTRLTNVLGARGPEWVADGSRVLFWQDMNANQVNAVGPNYQLSYVNLVDSSIHHLRESWQSDEELFLVTPTINRRDEVAFVFFDELQPGGVVVLPMSDISIELDSIQAVAKKNQGVVAPSWSGDDSWLALTGNYPDDSGLYISTPDLAKRYIVALPTEKTQISKYPASFSPDSKWLTFSTTDGSIWICDITGNGLVRLTRPGKDSSPCWSR